MASNLAQDALLLGHHLGAGALTRRVMAELVTAAEVLALADLGLVRPVLDSAGHASAVVHPPAVPIPGEPSPGPPSPLLPRLGREGTVTRLRSLVESPSHRLLDEAQDDLVVQGHLRSQKRRLRREKLTPVGGRGAYLLDRATDRSVTGGSESRRSAQLVLLCSATGSDVDRAALVACRRTALSPTDGAGHDGGREHLLDGLVTALVMAKAGTVTRG